LGADIFPDPKNKKGDFLLGTFAGKEHFNFGGGGI